MELEIYDDHGPRSLPSDQDPAFWPEVSKVIDEQLPFYKDKLKLWWLVHRIPFWYPWCGAIEVNYLTELLEYYSHVISEDERWRLYKGLTEPRRGHADGSWDQIVVPVYPRSLIDNATVYVSPWSLKCAHHIMKAEQFSGRDLRSYDHVVEIGGGLGDLARYCRDIEYTGSYTIFDLPSSLKLSRAYLEGLDVEFTSDVPQWKPNTLVIATWSLSEVPPGNRPEICEALKGSDWFVIFQAYVFGYNNVDFFLRQFGGLTNTRPVFAPIPFHQFQGGSSYLFAKGR